ncbi:MAG: sigma-54 dependent transcriptional regulator [Bacteroidales bacterium]|nr:sigma-54 dependent transcriptional regulator [Bacteroidales bacterium]
MYITWRNVIFIHKVSGRPMQKILIIDDDTYICKLLDNFLAKSGYKTETAFSGASAAKLITRNTYDLVISDYRLPDRDGFHVLEQVRKKNHQTPVIIMTAYKELETAIKLIKAGAYDYITKPLIPEELLGLIREALQKEQKKETSLSFEQGFIRGESRIFMETMEHVEIVSPVDLTVIIEGETGAGKEYVARAVHYNSERKKGPFLAVDCGALPKGVVNSELFGHVKGSFTGATFDKKGLFEQADGGTLFLDEISNLDAENQMKLLRVLQEKTVTRIGDSLPVRVDLRLIVASNEDLLAEVGKGKIREDLYHRLNEFKIRVPPLREREQDILLLADAFIREAAGRFGKEVKGYDNRVKEVLLKYHWPGNVRELKNVITRAALLATEDTLTLELIPDEVKTGHALQGPGDHGKRGELKEVNLKDAAIQAEKEAIIRALLRARYNKSEAARILNIDRKTLYNKIRQFKISPIDLG